MVEKTSDQPSQFSILAALRTPGFALLQMSKMCFFCARTMESTVTGWLVLELTNSALLLAVIGMSRMLPVLFLGAFSGVLVDRVDKRKMLLVTQSISVLLTLLLMMNVVFGSIEVWHIAVVSFALGILNSFDWPARMALMTDIIGREMLFSGVAVDNLSGYLMWIVGPTMGGWITGAMGVSGSYLIISMLFGMGAVVMTQLQREKTVSSSQTEESTMRSIVAGFTYVKGKPTILGVLGISIVMNLFGFPYWQLLPIFARDILVVGPEAYGFLTGITGVGATLAAILIMVSGGVKRVEFAFSSTTVVMALIAIMFSMSRWYALSLVFRMIAGIAMAYFEIGQHGLPLAHSTNEMHGRIMAILNLTIEGIFPIGTLQIGALATILGADYATLINGIITLILSLIIIMIVPTLRKTSNG
jgi:MFS family permease